MRSINETFTDKEFVKLKKAKLKFGSNKSWRDFILSLTKIRGKNEKQSRNNN